MSKPTDKTPNEPEKNPIDSTVEMPALTVVPELTTPQDTLVMPAYKQPKKPHLGHDEEDGEKAN